MKIGVTERGDAGIDLSWVSKMNTVDGAILITKNITNEFISQVVFLKKSVIVHVTCTGYGGSTLEPNVPKYQQQIMKAMELINEGFNPMNIVFRIDPIFPTSKGLNKVKEVLDCFINSLYLKGVTRIRVSIVDEYPHVRERYAQRGWIPIYGGKFQPSAQQVQAVADLLIQYPFEFETCAEHALSSICKNVREEGCVSMRDIKIMGIPLGNSAMYENPQGRGGCHCLSCKTELLDKRHPCANGCVYCFWKH